MRILFESRPQNLALFRRVRSTRHETAHMHRLRMGPGVTSPKSRPSGCRADHAAMSRFLVSSRTPFGIDDQLAVEGVGDLALQGSNSLTLGLALGDLAIEVGPAL